MESNYELNGAKDNEEKVAIIKIATIFSGMQISIKDDLRYFLLFNALRKVSNVSCLANRDIDD